MIEASVTNFSNSVDIVVGIFALLLIVSAAVAVVRVSVFKAQIDGLRGDRDDQAKRIDRLEEENATLQQSNLEGKARETALEARIKVLEGVVTGREELASISSLLQAHDRKTERQTAEVIKAIKEVKAS